MMRNKSQDMKRSARGTMILADVDARIVRKYMPYL
jgi:ribosomal protein L35